MIFFIIGILILGIWIILNFINSNFEFKDRPLFITSIKYEGDAFIWLNLVNYHRFLIGLSQLKPAKHLDTRANNVLMEIPPVEHHWNGIDNEIVGGGHATMLALFKHYLKSQGHKEIIEKPNLKYIGIGIKELEGKFYNVTLFL